MDTPKNQNIALKRKKKKCMDRTRTTGKKVTNFETMNTKFIKQILQSLTQLIFMVKFFNTKIK